MKLKKSHVNNGWYTLFCILSCGIVWVARVVITEAIRKAFEEE